MDIMTFCFFIVFSLFVCTFQTAVYSVSDQSVILWHFYMEMHLV